MHHHWPKLSFFVKTQWFGDVWKVWNDFDAIWWLYKPTKIPLRRSLKAIEVKSCILWKRTKMCGGSSKLSFFRYKDQFSQVRKVSSDFVRIFQFSKFRHKKECGKYLEPQLKHCNLCSVHHHWTKLSFFVKTQWFGDVWKVWNDFDAIWWLSKPTKIALRRSLKAIEVKPCIPWKRTKMCGGLSKLSFFRYEDQFGEVRKVSSDFVRIFQFPKFRHKKRMW